MQSFAEGPEASTNREYRPAAQFPEHWLVVSPVVPYLPASQVTQYLELGVVAYLPAVQSMQTWLRGTLANLPGTHSVHLVCAG